MVSTGGVVLTYSVTPTGSVRIQDHGEVDVYKFYKPVVNELLSSLSDSKIKFITYRKKEYKLYFLSDGCEYCYYR